MGQATLQSESQPQQTVSGNAIINELQQLRQEINHTNKLLTNILTQIQVGVSSFTARQNVSSKINNSPQASTPQQQNPAMAKAQSLVQQYAAVTGQQVPNNLQLPRNPSKSKGISGLDEPQWMNEGVPIQNI